MLPHLSSAYNLARWILRNEHDAEDCVQDAFVRAYRAFERFRGGDGRAWLLTIVRNVCYSRLRDERGDASMEEFDEAAHGITRDRAEMAEHVWREASTEILENALAALPPRLREIVVLHEIEGFSYREIANVVSIPIGTVMSRLSRARGRLHAELSERFKMERPDGL